MTGIRHLLAILGVGGAAVGLASCVGEEARADCSGMNGNAAVAACHPDVQEIQTACPDNSDGEAYAAPTRACLAAVRRDGATAQPAPPPAPQSGAHGFTCDDWGAASNAERLKVARRAVGTVNLELRVDAVTSICWYASNQNGLGYLLATDNLRDLAHDHPRPVDLDIETLPPTLNPKDPHQCFKRMDRLSIAKLNAGDIPSDCRAMGF